MADAAILLLAHGTPETLDDIPEYLAQRNQRASDAGACGCGDSCTGMGLLAVVR